ncbi:MAG: undecaprenyl/decaprenyl-phosphate alpha-N-acetylglucosaminyl 1-phosphate transferase [Phycisphaeraceae bacterium]|nr:undecaprenyl/decaprenyl-phosphate alpha-N-acetylglucosaminyl 1-phosphate transferase [Phycisphaeraceae bacterium]
MTFLPLMLLGQIAPTPTAPDIPLGIKSRIESLGQEIGALGAKVDEIKELAGMSQAARVTRLDVFHGYIPIFVIAFLVTLISTPLVRKLALAKGIVDRPSQARKIHTMPIAYLGGAAVFLGIIAAIAYSYFASVSSGWMSFHTTQYLDAEGRPHTVPFSIVLGMVLIAIAGLVDDVNGISPRLKVGMQLMAAAALAATDVGVKVAHGVVVPLAKAVGVSTTLVNGTDTILVHIPLPVPMFGAESIPIDVVYWLGTAVIAVFILGACNAANLIDGLDGLLTGYTAIVAGGLLVIALTLAVHDDGPRDSPRIVLAMALFGACLGFLPHNFNPATIFLGDCGSLLIGFVTITIILMLGDTGKTHLVLAGLIIFAIPIMDTMLAIIRRRLAGKRISEADDQHLHHMLKRALGVKGAVLAMYGIGAVFAALGIALSLGRARVVYALVLVLGSFIVVTAVKIARKKQLDEHAAQFEARRLAKSGPVPRGAAPVGGGPANGTDKAEPVGQR